MITYSLKTALSFNRSISLSARILLLLLFLITTCITSDIHGQSVQSSDSIPAVPSEPVMGQKIHSPHKATLYSIVLPGLGQAYNKKYWKIPIVYAGFGTLAYFIHFNNREYNLFKDAYYHSVKADNNAPPVNKYEEQYDTEALQNGKDFYRRNRDFSIILTGMWYLLNVIDAAVDAHLYTWEVSDELSLRITPETEPYAIGKRYSGVKIALVF